MGSYMRCKNIIYSVLYKMKKLFNKKPEAESKKNWKKISSEFTLELQRKWEDENFSCEECKKWINAGLKTKDANFASWLKKKSETPESCLNNIEKLRKEYEKLREGKRNILLIGRTGNGKSTLANVLVNKNDSFEEIFAQGNLAISKTRNIQSAEFEYKGINYRVIDTVGIDDTNCSQEKVLDELARACLYVKGDVSQIFFVTRNRFTKEEKLAYNLLSEVIFDKNVSEYTTIVRTGFHNFEDPEECQEDQKALKENEEITDLIRDNVKIIHVNNPPLEYKVDSDINRQQIDLNKKIRKRSREKLLECLEECSGIYESQNFYWRFYEELEKLIEEREKTIEEFKETRKKLKRYEKIESRMGQVTAVTQLASNIASFTSVPYASMPLNALSATAVTVNTLYSSYNWKYQRKTFNEFKETLETDKKIQEKCSMIKSMLAKDDANDPEVFASLLDQMDNVIKEFEEELKKMKKLKNDHEEKLKSWNREELENKIEKPHSDNLERSEKNSYNISKAIEDDEENNKNWFAPKHWLTDREIDWAIKKNSQDKQDASLHSAKFLKALDFMYARNNPSTIEADSYMSFPLLLSELTGFKGELVFIPVSQPDFHWSLLVYETKTKTFYHYDTLKGANWTYAKPLCEELLGSLLENWQSPSYHLKTQHDIRQDNDYDCGIAVIEITENIMKIYNNSLENMNLGEFDFPQSRNKWREEWLKIKEDSHEQQSQIEIPPK